MCGTVIAYAAVPASESLRYQPTLVVCAVRTSRECMRGSGTEIAYASMHCSTAMVYGVRY
eukprot:3645483-Rhodomonas_salina.1